MAPPGYGPSSWWRSGTASVTRGRPAAVPPVRCGSARTSPRRRSPMPDRVPGPGRRAGSSNCPIWTRCSTRGGLHQGRGHRLLRPGRAGAPAAPRRPAADPDPLPQRGRRRRASSRRTSRAARPTGCARRRCPCPGRPPAGRPSTSSWWTSWPPWSGWPTWPRSSCTRHSGGSPVDQPANPDLLVVDLDPAHRPGWTSAAWSPWPPAPARARRAHAVAKTPARRACSCCARLDGSRTLGRRVGVRQAGRRGPGAGPARPGHRRG